MRPVKKWIKIVLDAALFAVLALLYKKRAISMEFHEIAGLALIGAFVIHHLFNGEWIAAVSRGLFRRGMAARVRVQYALDVLLLVLFLLIGVSGAMMSKVVFGFGAHSGAWSAVHYFCSALAVIFGGAHIGLHAVYLFGFLGKRRIVRAAAYVLLAVVCVYGVYCIGTTSFGEWLASPFTASAGGDEARRQEQLAADGAETEHAGTAGAEGALYGGGHGSGQGSGQGNGQGSGQGNGQGNGQGSGQGNGQRGSFADALLTLLQFGSVMTVFAAVTALADGLAGRRRRAKAAGAARQA